MWSMVSIPPLFDRVLDALRKVSMFQASLAPAAYQSIPPLSQVYWL